MEQKVPWNWAAYANKQVFFIKNAWQGRWQLQQGLIKIVVAQKRHNFSVPTLQVVREKKTQKNTKTTESAAILSTHQTGAINRLVRYTAAEEPPTPPTPPAPCTFPPPQEALYMCSTPEATVHRLYNPPPLERQWGLGFRLKIAAVCDTSHVCSTPPPLHPTPPSHALMIRWYKAWIKAR